jgi:hypothetical protein
MQTNNIKTTNLSNGVELRCSIILIPSIVVEAVEIPGRAEGEPISDDARGEYYRWADGAEVDEGEGGCGKECKQATKEKSGKWHLHGARVRERCWNGKCEKFINTFE